MRINWNFYYPFLARNTLGITFLYVDSTPLNIFCNANSRNWLKRFGMVKRPTVNTAVSPISPLVVTPIVTNRQNCS